VQRPVDVGLPQPREGELVGHDGLVAGGEIAELGGPRRGSPGSRLWVGRARTCSHTPRDAERPFTVDASCPHDARIRRTMKSSPSLIRRLDIIVIDLLHT
jgi:hypothetical protein